MSKIMIIPKDRKMIEKVIDQSDAFLIGVKDFSINLPNYYLLDEIIDLVTYLNQNNKEVFISLIKILKMRS